MERQLDPLNLALLGAIAALSLLQGLLLLGAAWSAFRAIRRTERVALRMGGALAPATHELTQAARDAAEMSELIAARARHLDVLVTEVVEKVERTQRAAQRLLPVAARVAAAASVLKLLRSGVRAVRRLRR
jgi:hypothetical protein